MAKKIRAELVKIIVKSVFDDSDDLSYLGEFSNTEGDYPIKHSNGGQGEYMFFNAANVDNLTHAEENYNRMLQYVNGTVCSIGIVAEAEIKIPVNSTPQNWITQKISSGGLWGIESDSTEEYKTEIQNEQIAELKQYLKTLCVKGINKALIEYKDN